MRHRTLRYYRPDRSREIPRPISVSVMAKHGQDRQINNRGDDWRNPHLYEYTRALSRAKWAWEFLRRNCDYARDWASVQDHVVVLNKGHEKPIFRIVAGKDQMRRWGLIFWRRAR